MALKFLNKKGWHTGSLRNIENVWKAEQKHDAEQKKLEELRKQIQEERERHEFRLLQEQAGLTPKQERLDFLYESGLGVGKASEGFKALQAPAPPSSSGPPEAGTSGASSSANAAAPGALFEEKPQSANDAWRKLHSDPLLLIRQREQDALARIKSNPVKMAMIRKTVEAEKGKGKKDKKHRKKHHRHKESKHGKHSSKSKHSRGHSDSEEESIEDERRKEKRDRDERSSKLKKSISHSDSEEYSEQRGRRKEKRGRDEHPSKAKHGRAHSDSEEDIENREYRKDNRGREDPSGVGRDIGSKLFGRSPSGDSEYTRYKEKSRDVESSRYSSKEKPRDTEHDRNSNVEKPVREADYRSRYDDNRSGTRPESQEPKERQTYGYNHRRPAPKLTEEERAARLREMQLNAELHEGQRWKRLKKASEVDAQEAIKDKATAGRRTFLDDAQKSIYGTEKGGSSTIEESVRRRSYYLQGGSDAVEKNAFRR